MARGFGATLGSGTTDSIVTALATNHTEARSYAIGLNRHGLGGGSLGRVFTKQTATQVLQFFNNSADGHLRFNQSRATNGVDLT